jgi:hypothetical protein
VGVTADPSPLNPGDHYELAMAVRQKLTSLPNDNADLLLRRFGFDRQPSLGQVLIDADPSLLTAVAKHLNIDVPEPAHDEAIPPAQEIDTYSELVSAETAFREIVRSAIGPAWIDDFKADETDDSKPDKVEALR